MDSNHRDFPQEIRESLAKASKSFEANIPMLVATGKQRGKSMRKRYRIRIFLAASLLIVSATAVTALFYR